ncbi:MAG: metallophosphoesterase family protein [Archaeoglobaceae archaeon]|nr:metallophosphoesterase family protein [Archaeoglobales archaeon]MDI9643571.1 metallophosphoesterase family protein [Archaeoglobales archaeon]
MRLLSDAIAIGKKVVIADLHFGLVPFYDRELLDRVLRLAERFQTLIIAGDLKHLGKKSPVEGFLSKVSEIAELLIIRGNHDIGINGYKALKIGKYSIFHGHSVPEETVIGSETLIFAHAHPSVFIPAEVGGYKERAFLSGEVEWQGKKRVFVLPAFNELCSSTAVNMERPAGFMFRKFDYSNWDAILTDGTILNLKQISKR